jgi:hypothetical protein
VRHGAVEPCVKGVVKKESLFGKFGTEVGAGGSSSYLSAASAKARADGDDAHPRAIVNVVGATTSLALEPVTITPSSSRILTIASLFTSTSIAVRAALLS